MYDDFLSFFKFYSEQYSRLQRKGNLPPLPPVTNILEQAEV